jgi:hypothetical protein
MGPVGSPTQSATALASQEKISIIAENQDYLGALKKNLVARAKTQGFAP